MKKREHHPVPARCTCRNKRGLRCGRPVAHGDSHLAHKAARLYRWV